MAVDWRSRVDRLLRDGETVTATVSVGDSEVVVTDQRVFAFTPDGSGRNYNHVERPNVTGVDVRTDSDRGHLQSALAYGLLAGLFVVGGIAVDLSAAIDRPTVEGGVLEQLGLGGVGELIRWLFVLFEYFDEALLGVGALLLAWALVTAVRYARSRERALVIEVAGESDVHVPVPPDAEKAVRELRRALQL